MQKTEIFQKQKPTSALLKNLSKPVSNLNQNPMKNTLLEGLKATLHHTVGEIYQTFHVRQSVVLTLL